MSKYFEPPNYGIKGLELQWINNTVQSHDLICGCTKPFKHLQDILQTRGTQLCLTAGGTTEDKDDPKDGDAVDHLLEGELEDLFSKDFDEDDG